MVRRSTRLSNRNSATPKRASLAHDAVDAPHTVPARLTSIHESSEMPGAFPDDEISAAPPTESAKSWAGTPSKATPIKPSPQEMHPQHHQQSTAKPFDEARHLGFSNMGAHTAPPEQRSKIAILQNTPSKSGSTERETGSPTFQFTFRREQSLELSPQAKRLMNEKREEAARIRQQMIADGQGLEAVDVMLKRKIAIPKSHKGRYSQVHQAHFNKMDSIAGHASAFRADPARTTPRTSTSESKPRMFPPSSTPKSLKRSPSKAGLDEPEPSPARSTPRFGAKPHALPSKLSTSSHRKDSDANETAQPSPAKRVRVVEPDTISSAQQTPNRPKRELPITPTPNRLVKAPSHLKPTASPTPKSLPRSGVKPLQASLIPGPTAILEPSTGHANSQEPSRHQSQKGSLLSRSAAKITLPTKSDGPSVQTAAEDSPLLLRTPLKAGPSKRADVPGTAAARTEPPSTPLLSRSPTKSASLKKPLGEHDSSPKQIAPKTPLLAQSPLKLIPEKPNEPQETQTKAATVPFLARSPAKFPRAGLDKLNPTTSVPSQDGHKSPGRVNLLQLSPMKSILRSPQRLYSDDPAKVAAGTHFATPPPQRSTSLIVVPAVAATLPRKRVDFTSSTKPGEEPFSQRMRSSISKSSASPKHSDSTVHCQNAETIEYPKLPTESLPPSPSPQKRRLTGGPQDFTFRAGDHDIVFGPSPNRPKTAPKSPSSIRYVHADVATAPTPVTGSKKRKFDFENSAAATSAEADGNVSDKENTPASRPDTDETRPMKRSKLDTVAPRAAAPRSAPKAAPAAVAKKAATRVPTLGVKPKDKGLKDVKKRSNTITQSRLNALSQPKRRT